MTRGNALPVHVQEKLRSLIKIERLEDLEVRLGVSASTLARAAAGATLNRSSATAIAHAIAAR